MSKLAVTTILACALLVCHCQLATNAAAFIGAYDLNPIGISFLIDGNSSSAVAAAATDQQRQQAASAADSDGDPSALVDDFDTNRQDYVKRAFSKQDNDYGPTRGSPMSSQDLRRKIRLDQVLEALSASISATTKSPSILRSGRTYPSSASASGDQFAGSLAAPFGPIRLAGAARNELGQWQRASSANLLDANSNNNNNNNNNNVRPIISAPVAGAHAKSRKSANSGLVGLWFAPSSNSKPLVAASGAVPPFYSSQQAGRKLPSISAMSPLSNAAARSLELGDPLVAPMSPVVMQASVLHQHQHQQQQHQQLQAQTQQQHHRLGTEEVALHTPIHSYSASDNEWKRVENSRGRDWNNLRGMWGKRAISERYTNLDNFKDMLDGEARELASQTGEADELTKRLSRFNEQLDQLLQQQQLQQLQRQSKQEPQQTMSM